MTGPPTAPAAGGPRRTPKSGRPEGRTAGRHELARHPRFAEISPEVGVLDEEAMNRALAGDPTAFELLALMTTATDERLRAAAIRLSAQIVLDRARAGRPAMGGVSRLRPARGALDGDLDIDASIDGVSAARAEARPVGHDDLTTMHWGRPRTAFAVVVDRSGSMSGARLAAAATVAVACALRAPQEHAVLSFAATVEVIRPLASDTAPAAVAERLLGLRGHGVTRLADALKAARDQLAPARARRRIVILLSDCRSTDEDDTLQTARSLPELIILAPADDHEQAAQLAGLSGARWAPLAHPLDAAAALDQLLEVPADQRLGLWHGSSLGGGPRPRSPGGPPGGRSRRARRHLARRRRVGADRPGCGGCPRPFGGRGPARGAYLRRAGYPDRAAWGWHRAVGWRQRGRRLRRARPVTDEPDPRDRCGQPPGRRPAGRGQQ
jgi:Mg-chelatase subunit ChlD